MKKGDNKKSDYNLHKCLENISNQLKQEGYALSPEELQHVKDQIDVDNTRIEKYKDFESNVDKMVNYMSEYLDTFIIIGYDIEGNRVVFQNTKDSTLKQDALFKLLEQTFLKFLNVSRNSHDD